MKHEITKKTIIYRFLAFGLGMFITTLFLWSNPLLSLKITIVSESLSIVLYYVYEYYWRKIVEHIKIKKGMNLLSVKGRKVLLEYNVLEVLDENKFIIEVV